jgi:serine/threonine protein kinase
VQVVEVDGKPMPRIIDFGIAKAITQQAEAETLLARAGGMVGTPGYMSPEQADPTVPDVDSRTDAYSLSVVLYELLTGVLPLGAKQLQTKPFHVAPTAGRGSAESEHQNQRRLYLDNRVSAGTRIQDNWQACCEETWTGSR